MIHLVIKGEPVAQGRPRFTRRGNFIKTYDPKKSKEYKKYVISEVQKQYKKQPLEHAIKIKCIFYRSIQKSTLKRDYLMKKEHLMFPVVKPDIDNYFKCVTDALKGLMWKDDNQIVDVQMKKLYDEEPRTEIFINEID